MSFNLSAKEEETVYDNVKVKNQTTEQATDIKGKLKRNERNIQVLLRLGTFIVMLLVLIQLLLYHYFTITTNSNNPDEPWK